MIISKLVAKYLIKKLKPFIKTDKLEEAEARIQTAIEVLLDSEKDTFHIKKNKKL